jgi:hypothetical protein
MPAGDPFSYAVAAEENLEKLATELGRLGADEGTIEAVSQMADGVRQIVSVLGKGQQETGDDELPPEPAPSNYDEAAAQTQAMMQESAAQQQ